MNKLNSLLLCFFTPSISPIFLLHLCAEPLQSGEAEYPRPRPEGCSGRWEPWEGDGASVSDWCRRPATSRRQAHAGAAEERWHQGQQANWTLVYSDFWLVIYHHWDFEIYCNQQHTKGGDGNLSLTQANSINNASRFKILVKIRKDWDHT